MIFQVYRKSQYYIYKYTKRARPAGGDGIHPAAGFARAVFYSRYVKKEPLKIKDSSSIL